MDILPTRTTVLNFDRVQVPGCPNLSPEELIDLAIENRIARAAKRSLSGGDESFFIADLGQVTRQHRRWAQNLPNVQPYYGILFFLLFLFLLPISLLRHNI